ncbi:hypothetical protein T484DRAFT_1874381 [Baffinella frigidus]|nr:hypothetical protein T484DRAFT_1874381 [Cryptophyta sp. CCMP2293]
MLREGGGGAEVERAGKRLAEQEAAEARAESVDASEAASRCEVERAGKRVAQQDAADERAEVDRLKKLLEAMGDREKSHRKFQQRDKERIAAEILNEIFEAAIPDPLPEVEEGDEEEEEEEEEEEQEPPEDEDELAARLQW